MEKNTKKTILWSLLSFLLGCYLSFCVAAIINVAIHKNDDNKREQFLKLIQPIYKNEIFPNTTVLVKATSTSTTPSNEHIEDICYFTSIMTYENNAAILRQNVFNNTSNYLVKDGKEYKVDKIKIEYATAIDVNGKRLDEVQWKYFTIIEDVDKFYYILFGCWFDIVADPSSEANNNKYIKLPDDWEWTGSLGLNFTIENDIITFHNYLIDENVLKHQKDLTFIASFIENWYMKKDGSKSNLIYYGEFADFNPVSLIDGAIFFVDGTPCTWWKAIAKVGLYLFSVM